jgi:2-polyprenyl-3-methyl-5-hydroxy-6-metoxy-1,4-benzoquinol methylase
LIFETVQSYQKSAAIKAAIELDLFTAIAEGATTPGPLARRCEASERGVRILCDYLTIQGFLTKSDGSYALTQDSAVFLNRRSPAFMGTVVDFLLNPLAMDAFKDVAACVRKGGEVFSDEGTVENDHPIWQVFARSMMPMMAMPAKQIAEMIHLPDAKTRILDIAAGHGLFGLAFAERYPNAEVTALDWPKVLEVAHENAERAGVADRHHLLPGSAFEVDYGEGYDLILITNFLHHFNHETCVTLLRKVRAALADGGRAATLEFVPNDDRITPPMAASFSMTMLGTTPQGDAYTFKELESMLKEAGFEKNETIDVPFSPQRLIVSQV